MRGDFRPAPEEEWVYHLAVLRRTFKAIARYAGDDDREGMVFGGFLADALHNVPLLLRAWHEPSSRGPAYMTRWFETLRFHPPDRWPVRRRHNELLTILDREGAAAELGLNESLTDLQMPLPGTQGAYLHKLYRACLVMRAMNRHRRKLDPEGQSSLLGFSWPPEAAEQGNFNGLVASALTDVSAALACWPRFDEAAFLRKQRDTMAQLMPPYRDEWKYLFDLQNSPQAPG